MQTITLDLNYYEAEWLRDWLKEYREYIESSYEPEEIGDTPTMLQALIDCLNEKMNQL